MALMAITSSAMGQSTTYVRGQVSPTPTATATFTPTPTVTATPSATPTSTPTATATATATASPPPVMLTRPSINNGAPSGTGVLLTATAGTYTNSPTSYTREWRRNGVAIGGETGLTYTTASADQGKYLSFYEKAINAQGNSGFIRAETGNARQIFLTSESLIAPPTLETAINSATDTQFGAGAFEFQHFSVSSQNYDSTAQNFGLMATQSVDPNIDPSWGLVMSFDYANQFTGLQGSDNAATGLAKIYAFGNARVTAGAFGHIYCTSPYPNGVYHTTKNGTQAYTASEDIRANYASNGGVALVDFVDATLFASIDANDGIHWTSGVYSLVADKIVAGIVAAGLTPKCGGVYVPTTTGTHLKTYSNSFFYDPTVSLPWPNVATGITVTSDNGWAAKTVSTTKYPVKWVNTTTVTGDGWQKLYNSTSWQTHPLTGGHYTLNP